MKGHAATYESRRRSSSYFVPGHRRWGYSVVCECGWSAITDGNKRDAERMHAAHRREVRS
jgi:hypothetical protein